MKRSYLKRKTPLKRGNIRLRRKAPKWKSPKVVVNCEKGVHSLDLTIPKNKWKRSKLKPVSEKRRKEAGVYAKLRKEFLKEHPICQFCGHDPSVDVHHVHGRSGSNYLDTSTWKAVSRRCHDLIHSYPNAARDLGFLSPR